MESEFRKKIFDQDLFDLTLEYLKLLEIISAPQHNSGVEPALGLLRNTLTNAFTSNTSSVELHSFIKTLNLMDITPYQKFLAEFYAAAHVCKMRSPELFEDYRMTLRHLTEVNSFTNWEDFFKSFHALSDHKDTVLKDFLMTVRHLLLPHFQFNEWPEFFKATVMLSNRSTHLIPFLTSVRHSLNIFKKPETFKQIFKTLSGVVSPSAYEAYSYGQLESKKWLIDEAQKAYGSDWGTTFILAGWIGSLANMIFDTEGLSVEKIRSFDIDEDSCKISEKLNNPQVLDHWKYKAVCMDIMQMNYPCQYFVKRSDGSLVELYDDPFLVINTSCEHIERLYEWWNKIPSGTRLILQNNDAFQIKDHLNCVKTLEEFKQQLPLAKIQYEGTLNLPDYNRFMIIGEK